MNFLDPLDHFTNFLNEAGFDINNNFITPDLPFVLSTVSKDCKPSSRILFLKQVINQEFIFFTNKNSQKGLEILQNPNVSLCIFLPQILKQIRIEGVAEIAEASLAEEYFETRPAVSKAGAILSRQSEELSNYEEFKQSVYELSKQKSLKRPENWVAFKVLPLEFEFWEGAEFRLHLRTKYKKDLNSKNLWFKNIVYP